jgi:hypothetical protein
MEPLLICPQVSPCEALRGPADNYGSTGASRARTIEDVQGVG